MATSKGTYQPGQSNARAMVATDELGRVLASEVIAVSVVAVVAVPGTGIDIYTPSAATKKARVLGGQLSLSVAGMAILRDGAAGGPIMFRSALMAAGAGQPFDARPGVLSAVANNHLFMDASAAGTVNGTLFVTEE